MTEYFEVTEWLRKLKFGEVTYIHQQSLAFCNL